MKTIRTEITTGFAGRAVIVGAAICLFFLTSRAWGWSGETWGNWTRSNIVSRAMGMISPTWSPKNTIYNFGYGSTYRYFYKGTTYTGVAYSQNNPQENWSEFKSLVDKTGGGTTGYGNDCSGYASICWKLGSRYTTWTFENDAVNSGGYVDSMGGVGTCKTAGLKQGDACNASSSHIIIFNRTVDSGTMESMEQTPWTARKRNWSWSSLGGYRPIRRRNLVSDTPAPAAPKPSISWLDQGANSGDGQKVKVTCSKPANATELYYDMTGTGTNDYGWTGNTTYTDSGVYDSQTVSVRVKARGPGGESSYSATKSVSIADRTAPSNPAAPGVSWNDKGANSGNTQTVTVSRALTSGANRVEFDCTAGSPPYDRAASTATSYTTPAVNDSQTYTYRCRMWDAAGNYSSWSAAASVSIGDRTAPPDPAVPSIAWNDAGVNSGDTQSVTVSRALTSGANRVEFDCTAGSPAYDRAAGTAISYTTPADLNDSQTYTYRCRMWDAAGNYSGWSAVASAAIGDRTPPDSPAAPAVVWNDGGLNSGDTQSVTVSRPLTAGADRVEFESTAGTPKYNRNPAAAISYTTPADLPDYQVYRYRCRMFDAAGNFTSWSAEGSASIGDRTAPAAVGDLAATGADLYGAARLNWTAPADAGEGAEEYLVRYGQVELNEANWSSAAAAEGMSVPGAAGSGETAVVPGLEVRQTYYFGLKTRDRAGNTSGLSTIGAARIRSPARVERNLPSGYIPGMELKALISVAVAPEVAGYRVAEAVPAGWAVARISHGGSWNAEESEVNWGPLPGGWNSVLSYELMPPLSESGVKEITGVGDFDGVAVPVEGPEELAEGAPLPGDGDSDFGVTISEMVSYATAWKQGSSWPVPPNPVPIAFMVRGAYLWKHGESYHYDGNLEPPLCWQAGVDGAAVRKSGARSGGVAWRTLPAGYLPGNAVEVSIAAAPEPGAAFCALEETPPAGWRIGGISHQGRWDAGAGKVKWGLFEGAGKRVLSYRAWPPAGETGTKYFSGVVNIDGAAVEITGRQAVGEGSEPGGAEDGEGPFTPPPADEPRPASDPASAPEPLNLVLAGGDYDGDGRAEIALFRPASGLFAIRGLTRFYFGGSGDLPASGDYRGEGTTAAAIFRGSSGLFAVRGVTRVYFGAAGDIPVPADYDGSGGAEIAIFRPAGALWAVRGVTRFTYGRQGDIPVPLDPTGEGSVRPGIFRPETGMWAIRGLTRFYLGRSGDRPLTGDFTGEGRVRPAVFRPETGLWLIRGLTRFHLGAGGDYPVGADLDGAGPRPAIFRPSNGLWSSRSGIRTYYGRPGDIPIAR